MVADDVAIRFAGLNRNGYDAPDIFHAAHTVVVGVRLIGDNAKLGIKESNLTGRESAVAVTVTDTAGVFGADPA